MKRKNMKTLQRVSAWLLTLFLLAGELGGTSLAVYAAGDDDTEFIAAGDETEDVAEETEEDAAAEDETEDEAEAYEAEEAEEAVEAEEEAEAYEEEVTAGDEELPEDTEEAEADGLGKIGDLKPIVVFSTLYINGLKVKNGDRDINNKWAYEDGVLMLNGFSLTNTTLINGQGMLTPQDYGIRCTGDLTISMNGNCSIEMTGNPDKAFYGIYVAGNLNLTNLTHSSDCKLVISRSDSTAGGAGIYCGKDLTIGVAAPAKGKLFLKTGKVEINTNGGFNLGDTMDTSGNSTCAGIRTLGDLIIKGADVSSTAGIDRAGSNIAVDADGKISIRSGSLYADTGASDKDERSIGVFSEGGIDVASGASLKISAADLETYGNSSYIGMSSNGEINICGTADINAKGATDGIAVLTINKPITVSGSYVVTPDGGKTGVTGGIYNTILDSDDNIASKVYIKEGIPYDIWLGSTRIDSKNCKDLSSAVTGEGASASYDPATGTLLLNKVSGIKGAHTAGGRTAAIFTGVPLRIRNTDGTVTLNTKDSEDICILAGNNADLTLEGKFFLQSKDNVIRTGEGTELVIEGDGTTILAESSAAHCLDLGAGLTIKNAAADFSGEGNGIQCKYGKVELQGGRLAATGTNYAIYAMDIICDESIAGIVTPEGGSKSSVNSDHVTIVDSKGDIATTVSIRSTAKNIDDLLLDDWVYGEEAKTPTWTGHSGTVDTVYGGTLANGESYGPSETAPSKAGSYYVTVTETTDEDTWKGTAEFSILPKTVTVTATAKDRTYTGDNAVELENVQLAGKVEGDDVSLDPEELYGVMPDENAGSDKPVSLNPFLTLTGTDAANYSLDLTLTGVTVNIGKETPADESVAYELKAGMDNEAIKMKWYLREDAAYTGTVNVLSGEDQLSSAPVIDGTDLKLSTKAVLGIDEVVLELPVGESTNYTAYKVTVTLTPPHTVCTLEERAAVSADCLNSGNRKYYICSVCGKLYSDPEGTTEVEEDELIIPALGHDWDEGVITLAPTPFTDGVKVLHCTRCDATSTVTVPAGTPVHSPLDPVPEDLDTCTELYLVQGQKFNIGAGWEFAAGDKTSKRFVSVNKKNGNFKAKKAGTAKIVKGERTISITVCKPVITKSLKLDTGKAGQQIELKDCGTLDVFWHSAAPDVATVDQTGFVTPHSKGSAKVTAYINGSAYTCTVKVTEDTPALNRTLHLTKDAHKSISIKGLNKPNWKPDAEGFVDINNKKITGKTKGSVTLTAVGNTPEYTVDVYVEDITLSGTGITAARGTNKYTLDMTKGDDTQIVLDESVDQQVLFKSNKPAVVFVDQYGQVTARAAGTAKLTAKVNGKTITITVNVK